MANEKKNQQPIGSTQGFLPFSQIHEGIVVAKNGQLCAVLMVTSVNFALKSEQEQNAIIFAYQNFLNSLSFPIQIVMQSKRIDLTDYVAKLNEVANLQTNELLRIQTLEYIDYIEELIQIANIMDKKFFVTIPYQPPAKISKGLFGAKKTAPNQITFDDFKKYEQEINQRVKNVQNGLSSVGMRSAQLNTQQIVELFYGIYNPQEAIKQKLVDFNALNSPIVESIINQKANNE